MTDNEQQLTALLSARIGGIALAESLKEMLDAGENPDVLTKTIEQFNRDNNVSKAYEDDLDDLIAAMAGHCSSDYLLHPSNISPQDKVA